MELDSLYAGAIGEELVKRAGEIVFKEGDTGNHMYIVLDGAIEITLMLDGRRIPVARLGKGDFFGEMSLLEGLPRSGTASAAEFTKLLLVEEPAFQKLITADSAIALRIMKALSSRIRNMNKELAQRIGKDLQEVAASLRDNTAGIRMSIEQIAASASEIETNERQLAEEIKDVQATSKRIESIMAFIRTVSTQTHILGLNAGIEAARSGEHGRGFAVIAEEIRKLSAQSKENAEQIAELTERIAQKMSSITEASEGSAYRSKEQASSTHLMVTSTREMAELAARLTQIADSLKS